MRATALRPLNNVAIDLNTLESVEEICELSITVSEELLQFDLSVIEIDKDSIVSGTSLSENIGAEKHGLVETLGR